MAEETISENISIFCPCLFNKLSKIRFFRQYKYFPFFAECFLIPFMIWAIACICSLNYSPANNETIGSKHHNHSSEDNLMFIGEILWAWKDEIRLAFQIITGTILMLISSEIAFVSPFILSAIIATVSMYNRVENRISNGGQIFDEKLIFLIGPEIIIFFINATLTVISIIHDEIVVLNNSDRKSSKFYLSHAYLIYLIIFGLFIFLIQACVGTISAASIKFNLCRHCGMIFTNMFIIFPMWFFVAFIYNYGRTVISKLVEICNANESQRNNSFQTILSEITTINNYQYKRFHCSPLLIYFTNFTIIPAYWVFNFNLQHFDKKFMISLSNVTMGIICVISLPYTFFYTLQIQPHLFILKAWLVHCYQSFQKHSAVKKIRLFLWNIFRIVAPANTIIFFALRERNDQYSRGIQQRFHPLTETLSYFELVLNTIPIMFLLSMFDVAYAESLFEVANTAFEEETEENDHEE